MQIDASNSSGVTYPNGWIKSRLYEVFLSHLHFGISAERYEQSLEFVKIDERNRVKNCIWFFDESGRLIVTDLLFKDRGLQLAITSTGFEFIRTPHGSRGRKVFISYAHEDLEFARRLFSDLKKQKCEPWFDDEHLLPGELWKVAIEAEIRASHYFIPILSSRSVAKRGYVQKEIKIALDILDTMPESDIFIIPAYLERCEPSHFKLKELNRVDLFLDWDRGLEKILKVLLTSG
jgi:hypothetical protein